MARLLPRGALERKERRQRARVDRALLTMLLDAEVGDGSAKGEDWYKPTAETRRHAQRVRRWIAVCQLARQCGEIDRASFAAMSATEAWMQMCVAPIVRALERQRPKSKVDRKMAEAMRKYGEGKLHTAREIAEEVGFSDDRQVRKRPEWRNRTRPPALGPRKSLRR